jgi:hypothetical protein
MMNSCGAVGWNGRMVSKQPGMSVVVSVYVASLVMIVMSCWDLCLAPCGSCGDCLCCYLEEVL